MADPTLAEEVCTILRSSSSSLRAVDICRELAKNGKLVAKESVNRTLYHDPTFERAPDTANPPKWRVRSNTPQHYPAHCTVQVEGAGIFFLSNALTDDQFETFVTWATTIVPAGTRRVMRADGALRGELIARLAEKYQFEVVAL